MSIRFVVSFVVLLSCGTLTCAQDPQSRCGTEFSDLELQIARKNDSSFDKGLTAEWLLSIRKHGDHDQCAQEFCKAVFARTNTTPPEWWQRRLVVFLEGLPPVRQEVSSKFKITSNGRTARFNSKVLLLPKSYEEPKKTVFGIEVSGTRIVFGVTKQQELLPLLIFKDKDAAGRVQTLNEVLPRTWNPALATQPFGGFPEDFLEEPEVEFFIEKEKLIIFVDPACRPSVSVFDLEKNCHVLSFVVIREFSAARLNFKSENLRPADAGG